MRPKKMTKQPTNTCIRNCGVVATILRAYSRRATINSDIAGDAPCQLKSCQLLYSCTMFSHLLQAFSHVITFRKACNKWINIVDVTRYISRGIRVRKFFQIAKLTFKVTQSQWYYCHSIGHIRLPITLPLQLCLYHAMFQRYYQLLPKM